MMKRIGILLLSLHAGCSAVNTQPYDVLIRNGAVIDGTGAAAKRVDVGLRDGKVAFVGDAEDTQAGHTIDARGLAVAPGFIDAHNHVPDSLGQSPPPFLNATFLTQGVTTIVGGADGFFSPSQIRNYADQLARGGIGTNYAFYIGHNGIRTEVMGNAQRAPTPQELERMKQLVREGMELGAVGLSTGLMYVPGTFSDTREVIELAREVAPYDGIYDSHTRNPVFEMLASEGEAIEIGRKAGIPAKLAHLKAVGAMNEGRIDSVIALVEKSRAEGFNVVSDQYPYDGAAISWLGDIIVIPGEIRESWEPQNPQKLREALQDKQRWAAIREASEKGIDGGFSWIKAVGYTGMRIVDAPDDPALVGQKIHVLAEARGQDTYTFVTELILAHDEPIVITLGSIKEEDVRGLLVQPWNMIASDGIYADHGTSDSRHPRNTGTFTRVLGHYVRETGVLSLPEAVRKMTSLPADFLRLGDRGRIAVGQAADIVVFDPQRVRARSTYTDPDVFSEGIVHVLVNGTFALRDGVVTGATPGRFVKRQTARRQ